ncbi:MAG: dTDP-4-dehydrorhamnose 3,5-epimerase family protein [Chloroflexi bacterium]|nr:dTDP-4-dehydrorhamnose 3,5-epimerase family protein [Chloroflexota bacterium]
MAVQNLVDPRTLKGVIADVVVRRLKVNRDPRGVLVETLKTDWTDVYGPEDRPFAQTYYSVTLPGVARDEDRWHHHRNQEDRFVTPEGDILLALYDARQDSETFGRLNLIPLGEANGDDGQLMVVIPPVVYHCFMVVSKRPALLLNYPTALYDPLDEGRAPFPQTGARFDDGQAFTWDRVRAVYDLPLVGAASS